MEMKKDSSGQRRKLGIAIICFWLNIPAIFAQLAPLASQYYQNQYQGNPALAGLSDKALVNLNYRNQWRVIPGSPVTQSVTGDCRLRDKRVGVGINLYNDKAGLIRHTRILGTYAYHLPLAAENQFVHFGISLGVLTEKLDNESIIADPNDVLADRFNQRRAYIDGDFGIAYNTKDFTIQGALPNLKKFLKKDINNTNDEITYFVSCSYKIGLAPELVMIEPKFCVRGARGFNNLWDLGTDMRFANNVITLMGMYHSSKSSTFGFTLNYQDKAIFEGFYTSQLAALKEDSGGSFEIGLKIPLNIKINPALAR